MNPEALAGFGKGVSKTPNYTELANVESLIKYRREQLRLENQNLQLRQDKWNTEKQQQELVIQSLQEQLQKQGTEEAVKQLANFFVSDSPEQFNYVLQNNSYIKDRARVAGINSISSLSDYSDEFLRTLGADDRVLQNKGAFYVMTNPSGKPAIIDKARVSAAFGFDKYVTAEQIARLRLENEKAYAQNIGELGAEASQMYAQAGKGNPVAQSNVLDTIYSPTLLADDNKNSNKTAYYQEFMSSPSVQSFENLINSGEKLTPDQTELLTTKTIELLKNEAGIRSYGDYYKAVSEGTLTPIQQAYAPMMKYLVGNTSKSKKQMLEAIGKKGTGTSLALINELLDTYKSLGVKSSFAPAESLSKQFTKYFNLDFSKTDVLTYKAQQTLQSLFNRTLKERSGLAVTSQEFDRFINEMGGTMNSRLNVLTGISNLLTQAKEELTKNRNINPEMFDFMHGSTLESIDNMQQAITDFMVKNDQRFNSKTTAVLKQQNGKKDIKAVIQEYKGLNQ